MAALHDLENGAPEARGPSKAVVYETADVLTSFPLYDLFPLRNAFYFHKLIWWKNHRRTNPFWKQNSEKCQQILIECELANPVIFYSQTLYSVSQFLKQHKGMVNTCIRKTYPYVKCMVIIFLFHFRKMQKFDFGNTRDCHQIKNLNALPLLKRLSWRFICLLFTSFESSVDYHVRNP